MPTRAQSKSTITFPPASDARHFRPVARDKILAPNISRDGMRMRLSRIPSAFDEVKYARRRLGLGSLLDRHSFLFLTFL